MLTKLLEVLDIQQVGEFEFIGNNYFIGSPNVYGGHVMAQSVVAARRCIKNDKKLNSFHGYFLNPGDNDLPIHYSVEVIKPGKSFDVVRVLAKQNNRVIYITSVSFHIEEKGIEHQVPMPNATDPASLKPFSEIFAEFAERFKIEPRGIFAPDSPVIFHPVEYYDPFNPGVRAPRNHTWFKFNGEIPNNQEIQSCLLTYVSDFNLLITALFPHNMSFFITPMQIASLDHAIWFHRQPKIDDWCLYVVESSNAFGARAYCQGKIYSKDGTLMASVSQEGLIRKL